MSLPIPAYFIVLFLLLNNTLCAQDNTPKGIRVIPSPTQENKFYTIWEKAHYGPSFGMDAENEDSITGLLLYNIYKQDHRGNLHIIMHRSFEMSADWEYCMAISHNGTDWKKYHLGLIENNPYYIKAKSFVPLIKNDSIIQIEVAIVNMVSPGAYRYTSPEYELVQDHLLLEININEITIDSDKDGLTDIVENQMATNPFSNDTDKDGIKDGDDKNPLNKDIQNEYTLLYKFLLDLETVGPKDSVLYFDVKKYKPETRSLKPQTYIITTDDNNIKHVSGTQNTYLIMTPKEAEAYKKTHRSVPSRIYIYALTPYKNIPDYYILAKSERTWSNSYLIIKNKDHWIIRFLIGSEE